MSFTIECRGGVEIIKSLNLTIFDYPDDPNAFDSRVPHLTACVEGFCTSQCVFKHVDGVTVDCQAKNPKMGVAGVRNLVALAYAVVVLRIGPSPTDTPQ